MAIANEQGGIRPLLIATIALTLLVVGLGGFSVWSYTNYLDQKDNVDRRVSQAVAAAKEAQNALNEADFAERQKSPVQQFVGPSDLGQVSFDYPKTWSGYVDTATTASYDAYFGPGVLPPVSSRKPSALRVVITNTSYQSALALYKQDIKDGKLEASTVQSSGQDGMRLEGKFNDTIDGVMILMKIRDRTLKLYTESRLYQTDFDEVVFPSLKFNP